MDANETTAIQPIQPSPDDAFETEILPLRRRRLSFLTGVLLAAAIAAGAFVGGVEAQKHYGGAGTSATAGGRGGSFAGAFGSRAGTSGGSGASGFARGAGGGATIGTVSAIKGSTLFVTDTSGNTVKVITGAASTVSKTVTSNLKAIHPGDSVVVRGAAQKNGDVSAQSITLGGAGGFGVGGGGGFGGSGAGGASGFGGANNGTGAATGFGGGG